MNVMLIVLISHLSCLVDQAKDESDGHNHQKPIDWMVWLNMFFLIHLLYFTESKGNWMSIKQTIVHAIHSWVTTAKLLFFKFFQMKHRKGDEYYLLLLKAMFLNCNLKSVYGCLFQNWIQAVTKTSVDRSWHFVAWKTLFC